MKISKYTKEFRISTAQLALNSDKSATQIAKDLDVNEKTLYGWIRTYKQENNLTTESNLTSKNIVKETLDAENKRLRAELKVVTMEREILKKAAAYFAKEVL